MTDATISSLHVSQNIPQKSPLEVFTVYNYNTRNLRILQEIFVNQVTMENAVNNQIHVSQAVPMSSPLTWKLTGDIG